MKKLGILFGLLSVLGLCLYFVLREEGDDAGYVSELEMHCAAGLQKPVEEIARQYEEEFGVKIKLNFGGSGQLFAKLEVAGGDVYLPADVSYIEKARDENLVVESIPVSRLTAGIIVAKGNPKNIRSLKDLTRDDVRVVLAERSAAVGKFTHKVLEEAAVLEAIDGGVISKMGTVNEVALQVDIGAADAGIVWDALMPHFKQSEFVSVPEFEKRQKRATVGVLKSSKNGTAALKFVRYLTAKNKGAEVFKKHGFDVQPGDLWAEKPKVVFFSGSMLRPAIQDQLAIFEEREGCEITVKYAGCGELVALMRAGDMPDYYASCDMEFMKMVQDKFRKSEVVSGNRIVILVSKGNPRKIKTLSDLTQSDLKLGIADRTRSALGTLTYKLLEDERLLEGIEKSGNLQVLVAKGDDLVNQMQTGALDVALLYRSNAMASAGIMKHCEIIEIENKKSFATQPFAIAKKTEHAQLLERLDNFLTNKEGKESFMRYGFFWYKDAVNKTDE